MPDAHIRDLIVGLARGRALLLRHNRPELVTMLEEPLEELDEVGKDATHPACSDRAAPTDHPGTER